MNSEERFERIERILEFLAQNQAQLNIEVVRIGEKVVKLSDEIRMLVQHEAKQDSDLSQLVAVVGALAQMFRLHISDGHGGQDKQPDQL